MTKDQIEQAMTAERNAGWARKAHRVIVGYSGVPCEAGYESDLIDLLTELRHWCDAESIDFDSANKQAQKSHSEELKGLGKVGARDSIAAPTATKRAECRRGDSGRPF